MKQLLFLLVGLMMIQTVYGQTQLWITTIENTDRTIDRRNQLFLVNRATKHQLIYTLDPATQKLSTKRFLIERYKSVWDGENPAKKRTKTRHKKWSNHISQTDYQSLLTKLKTDIDTLLKDLSILHTSHHYLNIYVDVIHEGDTSSYTKTKPFTYLNPWWSNGPNGAVLNPEIDEQIATLLPAYFLLREKLLLLPTTE